jgi:hypothetical protein
LICQTRLFFFCLLKSGAAAWRFLLPEKRASVFVVTIAAAYVRVCVCRYGLPLVFRCGRSFTYWQCYYLLFFYLCLFLSLLVQLYVFCSEEYHVTYSSTMPEPFTAQASSFFQWRLFFLCVYVWLFFNPIFFFIFGEWLQSSEVVSKCSLVESSLCAPVLAGAHVYICACA